MDKNPATIPAALTVAELSERIARGDIIRALEQNPAGELTVLEAGSRNLILAHPDELLQEAVTKMLKNHVGRLLVVSREDPSRLLGYLGRTGLLEARLRKLQEEELRERRWHVVRTEK